MEDNEVMDPVSGSLTIASTAIKLGRAIHSIRGAIKDADDDVNDFFDLVRGLTNALGSVHDTLKSRPSHLPIRPSERQHHADIENVLRNCNRDLGRLAKEMDKLERDEEKTSKRRRLFSRGDGDRKSKVGRAWWIYVKDDPRIRVRLEKNLKVLHWSMTSITFAERYEDRASREAILEALHKLTRGVHDLTGTSSIGGTTLLPDGSSMPETEDDKINNDVIKAWADSCFNHTTELATEDPPLPSTRLTVPGPSKPMSAVLPPTRSHSPERSREEYEFMIEENKAIVDRLSGLELHLYASTYQRKGIDIRNRFERDYQEPFTPYERALMRDRLADILLKCDLLDCTEEALEILREVYEDISGGDEAKSAAVEGLRCSIELKLGKLYLQQRSPEAKHHLRSAYQGYLAQQPRQQYLGILKDLVKLVTDAYLQEGAALAELRAFVNRAKNDLGGAIEPPSRTWEMTREWCRAHGFDVPADPEVAMSQHFLFDHLVLPDSGRTPLHVAADDLKMSTDVLQEMLKHIDTANAVDDKGETALLVAVGRSNVEVVGLLLDLSDASVHVQPRPELRTVLHRCENAKIAERLVERLARRGSIAVNGFPIPGPGQARRRSSAVPPHSASPPKQAIFDSPSPGLLSPSLPPEQLEIDLNTQDCYGRSALHYAAKNGNLAIVNILLKAPSGADPNLRSLDGETPLMFTLTKGHVNQNRLAVIRRLIDAEANPRLRNVQGQDAFDAVKKLSPSSRDEIKKLLLSAVGNSPGSGTMGFENRRGSNSYSLRPTTRKSSMTTVSSGRSGGVFPDSPRSASVGGLSMAMRTESNGQVSGAPRLGELKFEEKGLGLAIGTQFG